MPTITSLTARQILDSRGNPTVEVDCVLSDGSFGRAAVPSGASTGSHEAIELRDGEKGRYGGKSVTKAVSNVTGPIHKLLKKKDAADQRAVDKLMIDADGTKNKSSFGANAILGVSMAIARARAASEKKPLWQSLHTQFGVQEKAILPVSMMNVINGGAHADSGLSFQECMIVPTEFETFADRLRAGAEIFHTLKDILKKAGQSTAVGDEGGFAPHLKNSDEAMKTLVEAIHKTGYEGKVKIALDCAASEFYKDGTYTVDGQQFDRKGLVDFYANLVATYPIISIEDSHAEDDWEGFILMQKMLGSKIQLVGDDLFVTNVERLRKGIELSAANAILIKLNQIGTVSETVDAITMARKAGWKSVVSHRSGETEDTFIADLAVGLATGQIKTGSLSRTDRTAKYNQLLRIEEEIG